VHLYFGSLQHLSLTPVNLAHFRFHSGSFTCNLKFKFDYETASFLQSFFLVVFHRPVKCAIVELVLG
jgi:hypothetical protein